MLVKISKKYNFYTYFVKKIKFILKKDLIGQVSVELIPDLHPIQPVAEWKDS